MELLFAPEGVVFSAALLLMVAIGLIEALGLGLGSVDVDLGLDFDHGGVLGWLAVGRVPLLVLIVAFLAAFGTIGLAVQQLATMIAGQPLAAMVAVPAAGIAALPATALLGRGLARVLPRDETTALDLDDLIGRTGTILVGRASAGCPARTRVLDRHGQAHHLFVEPNDPAASFAEGSEVRLVRREGDRFRAIPVDALRFSDWIS